MLRRKISNTFRKMTNHFSRKYSCTKSVISIPWTRSQTSTFAHISISTWHRVFCSWCWFITDTKQTLAYRRKHDRPETNRLFTPFCFFKVRGSQYWLFAAMVSQNRPVLSRIWKTFSLEFQWKPSCVSSAFESPARAPWESIFTFLQHLCPSSGDRRKWISK